MKINRLDAHDRHKHLVKQDFEISACCQNLIDQKPFGNYPFYIFAHTRTDDNGIRKRLIWQPRLTKPKAQSNSMLFKAYPGTDNIKIIWMIPAKELWGQYDKGKVTEDDLTKWSIDMYLHHKSDLELAEDDDLSDEIIDKIYTQMSKDAQYRKARDDSKFKIITPNMR